MKNNRQILFRRCLLFLLYAYPRTFRDAYGEDLVNTYTDQLASLQMRGIRFARARVMTRALWHAVRDGTLERFTRHPRDPGGKRTNSIGDTLRQDLGYTIRSLARKPAFFCTVMMIFALGIGANTVIFSLVNGILLRPLPYAEPDRLVTPWQTHPHWLESPNPSLRAAWNRLGIAYPVYENWLEMNTVFEALGLYCTANYTLTGGDRPEVIQAIRASHGVFDALGVAPLLGRTFLPQEDVVGGPNLALLSYGLWQQRFGADPDVISRTISLDEQSYTIVGIMPRGFSFPDDSELWVTFPDSDRLRPRNNQFAESVARLRPGITLEQAQRDMAALQERLNEIHPIPDRNYGFHLEWLYDEVVGDIRPALLLLLGTVGLFLFIACVNIANLLLVRATERRRELAIRSSLGAGRARLLGQLLTESVAVSVAGGMLGLLLAVAGLRPLVALMPAGTPRLVEVGLDHRVLIFTAALSVLTGVIVGLMPALGAVRTSLTTVLQDSGRGTSSGRRRTRRQSILLVCEIALTFVLLTGAGLITKSFVRLITIEPGFEAEGVLTLRLQIHGERYASTDQVTTAYRELQRALEAVPGVTAVARSTCGPFLGGWSWSNGAVVVTPTGPVDTNLRVNMISESYGEIMGIPLLSGRPFTPEEIDGAVPAAIVSANLAQTYWPHEDAIGQRLKLGHLDSTNPWSIIVGIVGDVRERLNAEPYPTVYFPVDDDMWARSNQVILLKTTIPPESVIPAVQETVSSFDPDLPISSLSTVEEHISRSVTGPRIRTVLLSSLAGLAILLSVVGVFGVLAHAVSQRTSEIGIRMALGADKRKVVRDIVRRSLAYLGLGMAVGLAVTLTAVPVIEDFLFEVDPLDQGTLVLVALLLLSAVLAASYLPARRAARVDPVEALRRE